MTIINEKSRTFAPGPITVPVFTGPLTAAESAPKDLRKRPIGPLGQSLTRRQP